MNNKFKCAIFDLDGVIVDTAKYHYLAWASIAKELGFSFDIEQNEKLKGVSRMKSLDILLECGKISNLDKESKIQIAEKKNKIYLDYIKKINESELLPGSKEFIEELKERGIKIALASASKNALIILNNTEIKNLFDSIIDGNKVKYAKPDPEVFCKACEELKVFPKECVVFEDSIAGIEGANSIGMYTVGIGNEEILKDANYIIGSLKELNIDEIF